MHFLFDTFLILLHISHVLQNTKSAVVFEDCALFLRPSGPTLLFFRSRTRCAAFLRLNPLVLVLCRGYKAQVFRQSMFGCCVQRIERVCCVDERVNYFQMSCCLFSASYYKRADRHQWTIYLSHSQLSSEI